MATQQQSIRGSGLPDFPRGMDLLNRQGLNKGTGFTEEKRSKLGLHALLPPHVESLEEQTVRAYEAYKRKDEDLERHIYLRALLPPLTDIPSVAAQIAIAVGMEAQKDGLAPKLAEDELRRRVTAAQWTPAYPFFGPTKM